MDVAAASPSGRSSPLMLHVRTAIVPHHNHSLRHIRSSAPKWAKKALLQTLLFSHRARLEFYRLSYSYSANIITGNIRISHPRKTREASISRFTRNSPVKFGASLPPSVSCCIYLDVLHRCRRRPSRKEAFIHSGEKRIHWHLPSLSLRSLSVQRTSQQKARPAS
ncbi:hypothetical protein EJ05DRAFT_98382 [Pseudovirgaria hyperparasitica]|uniref:Uncharacterized protein n=1 Tax=Pseudovirgaria hyperparasitica TaxID=470096 RepID=A0A6A6VXI5_9PEZI|nr:uncharacterized protein EJ05DRAFT_98382 [Pseudovirgaria hyperparasitica]KAF2755322.1 hypothetical protein EJ05DRAFT_98382 [Pseudovirgaria hyperparasitica]